jgi:hypothetical protein
MYCMGNTPRVGCVGRITFVSVRALAARCLALERPVLLYLLRLLLSCESPLTRPKPAAKPYSKTVDATSSAIKKNSLYSPNYAYCRQSPVFGLTNSAICRVLSRSYKQMAGRRKTRSPLTRASRHDSWGRPNFRWEDAVPSAQARNHHLLASCFVLPPTYSGRGPCVAVSSRQRIATCDQRGSPFPTLFMKLSPLGKIDATIALRQSFPDAFREFLTQGLGPRA